MFQMHADLVGAAGFGTALEEREVSRRFQHAPCGLGLAGPGAAADGHALAVHGVAGDGAVHGTGRGAGAAADHGEVSFFRGALGELPGERGVGGIVFRDQDATAGVLVETVDDSRSQGVAARGDEAAVVEDGVDQRALPVTRGGMDNEAGRLVQAEQVVVLVEDVERDVLGHGLHRRRRGRGRHGLDAVARSHGIGRAGGGAVQFDQAGGERFLPAGAAELRPLRREPAVEPRGALRRGGGERSFHDGPRKRWTFPRLRARFAAWTRKFLPGSSRRVPPAAVRSTCPTNCPSRRFSARIAAKGCARGGCATTSNWSS